MRNRSKAGSVKMVHLSRLEQRWDPWQPAVNSNRCRRQRHASDLQGGAREGCRCAVLVLPQEAAQALLLRMIAEWEVSQGPAGLKMAHWVDAASFLLGSAHFT